MSKWTTDTEYRVLSVALGLAVYGVSVLGLVELLKLCWRYLVDLD